MESYNILIVEDEILVAELIQRYLLKKGYEVAGVAGTYEEAEHLYTQTNPDLVLINMHLSASWDGIEFASFLQEQQHPVPFIFMASQLDSDSLNIAKKTFPAGYLSKPVNKESLYANIEIAMHKQVSSAKEEKGNSITVSDGKHHMEISCKDILFLKADHIYVEIELKSGRSIYTRTPLSKLIEQLPTRCFAQTHRSYVINLCQVTEWNPMNLHIQDQIIPISRSRKRQIHARLKAMG